MGVLVQEPKLASSAEGAPTAPDLQIPDAERPQSAEAMPAAHEITPDTELKTGVDRAARLL